MRKKQSSGYFRGDPYEHLARGYDLVAPTYDEIEGRNQLSERVRRASLEAALTVFQRGDLVLELGCGTGRDAVTLALHGIHVVATDVSPAMVMATRKRAADAGVPDLVHAEVLPAAAAARLGGPYDGAYSNGAVLNMEPRLAIVAEGLALTVRSGGRAVLSVLNRVSLFEMLFYPLALRPRKAFRKLSHAVPIPVSRKGPGARYVVPTHFLTPSEFLSSFGNAFDVEAWRGLQVITPPWNLVDEAATFAGAVAPLVAIEDRISRWPWVRGLGAIFLLTLRRRGI